MRQMTPPRSQRAVFPIKEENLDNGYLSTPNAKDMNFDMAASISLHAS
jgi:hypothetical protein